MSTSPNGLKEPGAIIIGGAHGSLAIARSLGRRGIPVWFITDDHPITKFSRYCLGSFRWAGPQSATAADDLLAIAREHRLEGWVLFAGGDPEVRLICRHYPKLSSMFRLTTPPWSAVRFGYDKRLTHERAVELGIAYPSTRYPQSAREVAELECSFPLILKPTVREGRDPFTSAKAWRVDSRAALLSRYREAERLVSREAISLQELIPGGGEHQYSYAAVWHNGVPIASLTARRRRQYPIDFGYTSTCVEVVDQPEVEEAACRFLRSLDYSGPVEVEFKYDARDGRFKLLDVNARIWTWNALGAAAGTDFPLIAWQCAIGALPESLRGRPGATWFHVSRDLVAACHEILRGGFFSLKRRPAQGPAVFAAFAADDPLPGIIDLPLTVCRAIVRRLAVRPKRERPFLPRNMITAKRGEDVLSEN